MAHDYTVYLGVIVGLSVALISNVFLAMLSKNRFNPQGKVGYSTTQIADQWQTSTDWSAYLVAQFCYITGGSSGLGRALAVYLVKQGAYVTIVAREVKKLGETKALLRV